MIFFFVGNIGLFKNDILFFLIIIFKLLYKKLMFNVGKNLFKFE